MRCGPSANHLAGGDGAPVRRGGGGPARIPAALLPDPLRNLRFRAPFSAIQPRRRDGYRRPSRRTLRPVADDRGSCLVHISSAGGSRRSALAALRDVGEPAKAVALQALARHALAGDMNAAHYPAPLPTGVALKELEALPGSVPWSAGLILLRGLRRMDVCPAGDVGAARNLPSSSASLLHGPRQTRAPSPLASPIAVGTSTSSALVRSCCHGASSNPRITLTTSCCYEEDKRSSRTP